MLARIATLTAAVLSLFVGVALADAPNPIPGTTTLVASSGSLASGLTITIEGQWNWTTHPNCPKDRDGVGYQVAWFDGNTANAIGMNNSPSGIIYVGDAVDNMVLSLNNLDPSNTNLEFGGIPGAPFGAVPASYLSHNTTSSAPTMTDATNWNSNCGTVNPTTTISSGTWGPISHTYPAGFKGPVQVCPIMYDPHGKSENAGGSGVGDLTAGGMGHNNDSSYEGNGNNDACLLTSFPTLTTTATAAAHETQPISDSATLSGSNSAQGSISWSLLKYPSGTTAAQIATDQCKSGTPITGQFTTTVNGDGTYMSPSYTPPSGGSGVYQWVATYNSSNSNNASTVAVGCGQAAEESVVTPVPVPSLSLSKQQEWLSVTSGATPTPPVGTYTSNSISGAPGWVVQYLMTVKNTGNETAGVNFADSSSSTAGCDSGTLNGPTVASGTYTAGTSGNGYGGLPTLTAGGVITYTCQHTVKSTDNPWVNTATLSGIDVNGTAATVTGSPASVQESAVNPSVSFAKTQTIQGSNAPYTHSALAGAKGQVVLYQMTVTNPSASDPLALTLSDPGCAAGTLTAPTGSGVSGTTTFSGAGNTVASGNTLAPGSTAVYACQHTIAASDTPFTNTATLTAIDTITQQHLTATDSVSDTVEIPSITLTKGEQVDATAPGGYVHGPVTAYVGDTINYLITIANAGPIEVTPTLTDATGAGGTCDAGTLKAVSGLTNGKIAAGASATWTCSHLVTASDPTTLSNTASATAVDDFGNATQPASDTVTANVLTLTLTLTKVQRIGSNAFTSAALTANPDDIITYQMSVTNTSNQALTPHFSDPTFTTGSSIGGCDAGTLVAPTNLDNGRIDAGASAIWTCSHTVNETDPSPFVNTATVFGTDSNGHSTPTQQSSVSATIFLNPAMTTQKLQYDATTNPSGPYTSSTITANVGDTIDYKVIVNNTGNEDLTLTATDPGCGTTLVGPTITPGEDSDDLVGNTLEQGASAMYTCSRTLSAADSPSFTNVATITGTPPVGAALPPQKPMVTVNVITNPAFSIVKTQSVGGSAYTTGQLNGQVGQIVSYQVSVTNTGNTLLSFSNFVDADCDSGTISGGPAGSLPVNQTAVYDCQHTLTFADQGVGSYSNQATVTATPPTGEGSPVTNTSNVVTVKLAASTPAFTISKAQQIGTGGTFVTTPLVGQVGQTINYQIVVTNTGNVPLTFTGFSDANCSSLAGGPGSGAVAVNASTTWTCSHTITTADQSAGSYSNFATVTGNPPANDGTPTTTQSNTVVTTVPTNSFTISKTQSIGTAPFVTTPITGSPGQVVNYQITVTNTGTTALTLSNFIDPNCDTTPGGGPGASPVPVGGSTIYICLHTLTFADQGVGVYTNQASVLATPPAGYGSSIAKTSNQVIVDLTPANAGFTLSKAQSIGANTPVTTPIVGLVGQTINYQIVATNTGGVPLTFASFTDAGCDAGTLAGGPGANAVAVNGTATWTCSHTITAADQTATSYSNTAKVTGSPPTGDGSPITNPSNTVVATVPTNQFTILKTQQIGSSGYVLTTLNGAPGQTVSYQITVDNTGNTALTFSSFSDANCDAGTISGGPGSNAVAPGGSTMYTCSHVLTFGDQAAGSYVNQASVTATPPAVDGAPFAHTSNQVVVNLAPANPGFTVVKSQSIGGASFTTSPVTGLVGQTINYQIVVTNTGTVPLTFTNFSDANCGSLAGGPGAGAVAVNGTATWTCSHTITTADQAATLYTNSASVTGNPPAGDGSPVTVASNTVIANVPTNAFTIVKTQSIGGATFTQSPISGSPGQTVNYQITLTNTGNTPLTFSGFSDANCDPGTLAGGPGGNALAANATSTYTCSHVLTYVDQGAGTYTNQASVTGTPPAVDGSPVSHTSNQVVVNLSAAIPGFTLVKSEAVGSGAQSAGPITGLVGQTVNYQITASNTGNVPLTFANFTDPNCTSIAGGPGGNPLAPNATSMWTCSHTLTATDQKATTYSNQATVTASPPAGDGNAFTQQSNTVVADIPTNSFTIVKTQAIGSGTFTQSPLTGAPGQVVNYQVTLTNTGNTALTFSSFTDANCDPGTLAGGPGGNALAANASSTYTCSHTLTFADQGAGTYTNQATVTATPPSGDGAVITQPSNQVVVNLTPASSTFTISKSQQIGSGGSFVTTSLVGQVGQTIDYQIVVTNTGNVPLTFTNFTDSKCSSIAGGPGSNAVAPNAATTWTCSHVITSADQTASSYSNFATVTGNPPANDGSATTTQSNTVVTTVPTNSYTIVKTQSIGTAPFVTTPIGGSPGQVVNYQITVTNTGNTPLTLSSFTDPDCDTIPGGGPGAAPVPVNGSTIYTCLHTLTYADQGAGVYTNQATVLATPPAGYGSPIPETSNQVVVNLTPSNAAFTLVKYQSINGGTPVTTPLIGLVGQMVDYQIVVTNTGNVPLTFSNFTDANCDTGTLSGGPGSAPLAVNGTATWTCMHTLTVADQTTGSYSNVARVTGSPPTGDGSPVTNPSNTVVTTVPTNQFTIVKAQQIGSGSFTQATLNGSPGQTVNYQIMVSNTGNTALTFSNFTDANCDTGTTAGGPGANAIAPGGSTMYTCSHLLTFGDQAAGSYSNEANVTATPPAVDGAPFAHTSNQVVVNLAPANPGFTVSKSQSIGGASFTTSPITGLVGQTINYQIVVTNTGTVPLTFTNFSDANCGSLAGGPGGTAVAVNGTATWTCSHTITSADQAATLYSNAASVTGNPPAGDGNAVTVTSNTVVTNIPTNAFTIVKTQSIGGASFTQGPLSGSPGQTVNYQITLTNTGNTALAFSSFADANCDPGTVAGGPGGSALAAKATSTYTCSHTLTFADQGAGSYTNQASVTATPPSGDGAAITQPSNQVVVNLTPAGTSYTLVKTEAIGGGTQSSGPITGLVGQTVNYQITATNTGNTPLTFSNFTDANCTSIAGGPGAGAVAPNATTTWTCSHTLTTVDQTATSYSNQASVTATPPSGDGNPITQPSNTVVTNVPTNSFTIVKTESIGAASFTQGPISGSPGQTVNYQITVTNTGNSQLTFSGFTDANCDTGTIAGGPGANPLAAHQAATYTCSHVLSFADQGAGSYTNQASVTATPPAVDGAPITQPSNQVVVNLAPASTTFTIVKSQAVGPASFTTSPVIAQVGQVLNYQIVVTNTGTVPQTFTAFSDANCDAGTISGGSGANALAPNASTTWTCSHAVTAADQTAGSYSNFAKVTGNPPANDGSPTTTQSNTVVATVPTNAYTIVKTQSIGGAPFVTTQITGSPGQVVNYQITVTNKGNTPLTLSNFTDANCDTTPAGGPGANPVSVGGSTVYTCLHTLTYADQGAGVYTNQATVLATPPAGYGAAIPQTSNQVVVSLAPASPGFSLVKSQSISGSAPVTTPIVGLVGQTVNYQIVVTNTGNVPLTFSGFSDPNCDAGTIAGGPGASPLATNATATWTCSHTLTAADQTAGSYSNVARVTGTPPADDGSPLTNPSNTVVTTVPTNQFTIVKTQQIGSGVFTLGTLAGSPGQTVNYQITVTNTGNTALTFAGFSDPNCDPGTVAGGPGAGAVAAGASTQYTCSHLLTFVDQAAGSYTNQATVTATPPAIDGAPFAHTSNQVVVNLAAANPGFTIVKSQAVGGGSLTTSPINGLVGQTIDYQIVVTNTGTVPLTFTNFSDANCGSLSGGSGANPVAVNASTTWTCSHTITTADQAATLYTNSATVTGNPPSGDGNPVTVPSNTVVTNIPTNAFTIVKTQSIGGAGFTQGPITGSPGQTVNYQITVTNAGNTALTFSGFTDANCDAGTIAGGPGGTALASKASSTYTCSHLLTFADQGAGTYTNQASVTATPPSGDGSPVTQPSNQVVVTLAPASSSFALVKTEAIGAGTQTAGPITGLVGQAINYQITATNTSNVPLTFSNFSDPNCTTISGGPGANTVAPNASTTWTCSHTITSADQAATSYSNQATVTGNPPTGDGSPVTQPSNTVVANVPTNSFTIVKAEAIGSGSFSAGPLSGTPGQTVNYQITVSNTGNTALTLSGFSDANCDAGTTTGGPGAGAVAAKASTTYICSHVLTFADQGAGSYTNQASVTATPPSGDGSPITQPSNQVVVNLAPATPAFTIVKSQEVGGAALTTAPIVALLGQTVEYQIVVTNTGSVPLTFSAFTDANCDAGTLSGGSGTNAVAVGGTATWACSHTITAGDQTAGSYSNFAKVTGNPPVGDGSPTTSPSNTVVANVPNNAFTIVKTQSIGGAPFVTTPLTGAPGQVVNYQITLTNSGTTALTFPTFTDAMCDSGTIAGGPGGSAVNPGATTTFTCSHTLTFADQGAGSYANTASATADPPSGDGAAFSHTSNQVVVTLGGPQPAFTIVKTESIGGTPYGAGPITGQVGQTVNYQITVTDTGNTPLTFGNFIDADCDPGTLAGGPGGAQLAAGAAATYTCSHLLAPADETAGSYSNFATVTGTPPANDGSAMTNTSNTVVVYLPNIAFTLVKTQAIGNIAPTTATLVGSVGQTVDYTITATDTGNAPLTFSGFSDVDCDAGTLTGGPGSAQVAVGKATTWTCTHKITGADQNAGSYSNQASVTGNPPANDGSPVNNQSNVVVVDVPDVAFTFVKTQAIGNTTPTTQPITGAVGEVVNYTITATNTGNVVLTFSGFSDPNCDPGTLTGGPGNNTIAVGATATWTCTHTLTAADMTAGSYSNQAAVTGSPPANGGSPVSEPSNTVIVNLPNPAMTIVKSQRDTTTNPGGAFTQNTITATVGDTIQYQIVVSNTGNVPLKPTFSDLECGANTLTGPTGGQFDASGNLDPGSSTTYDCSIVLVAGNVPTATNTATVTGTPPGGSPIGPFSSTVTANVMQAPNPSLHVVKTQELSGSSSGFSTAPITASVGQTVLYHMTVTNTGNVPLKIALSDPRCDAGTLQTPTTGLDSNGDVPVGGSVVYSCSHTILAINRPAYTNTVSVTGTPPNGVAGAPVTSAVTANVPAAAVAACVASTVKSTLTKKRNSNGSLSATVNGKDITEVTFLVDGRGYKTLLKPNVSGGAYQITLWPREDSFGKHTITANVSMTCHGLQHAAVTYTHAPPRRAVVPRFTG